MKPVLDCSTLTRWLSQSQDHKPPQVQQVSVRLHLATCRACRDTDEQLRFVRAAVRALRQLSARDTPAA